MDIPEQNPEVKPEDTKPEVKNDKPADKPKGVELSQEEFNSLTGHAANYQTLLKDPQLVGIINDYFKGKMNPPNKEEPKNTIKDQIPPDQTALGLADLKKQLQAMQQERANQAVELFRIKNPDMDTYKDGMAKVLTKYPNMSLDDAYAFVKGQAAKPQQQPNTNTSKSTTETGSHDDDNSDVTEEQQLQDKLMDRKSVPTFDAALKLAMAAAAAKARE